jgi:hypothetical protein
MSVTVLNPARGIVVTSIPIHNKHPWQRIISKHCVRDLGRTILAELKNAQLWSSEKPDIPVLAVSAPTRLISMFHRSRSIFLYQAVRDILENPATPMKDIHKAPGPYTRMFGDSPHRKTKQIVHRYRIGDQLIAIKAFGKDPGAILLN